MLKSLQIDDIKKELSVSYVYLINRNSDFKLNYNLKYCYKIMLKSTIY